MDADEARKRASLLCLDVPQGTLFGVDLQAWTTGPLFKGVKIIPPGTHIFYYK
jgi:A1 cistron-splicing factor AAR2